MMNSPEGYLERIKDYSYEKLIKERNELIREIHRFERRKNDTESTELMMRPSPETVYYYNNIYLVKVCELINLKISEKREKGE